MFKESYQGKNKKIFWQEMWRHEFHEALEKDPVIILPTGSIEQHGPHCPMDVDISIPFHLAVEVAQTVDEFPTIVAPPLWWGLSHYNKGFPGTISLELETFQHVLADVCRSIYENGFKRIVVLNGHGGNDAPVRTVRDTISEENIFIISYSWWQSVEKEMGELSEADGSSVGHAGEWETSVQLYLRENLVSKENITADRGLMRPFSEQLTAFARFAERRSDTEEKTGVSGNAEVATKDKGKKIFNLAASRLEEVVREFHTEPVRDYWEFGSFCPK